MRAAVLPSVRRASGAFLQIEEVPRPRAEAGQVLLRVVACGVCRTDLHLAEGDLPAVVQQVTVFPLEEANEALMAVKEETGHGSAVIVP